MYEEEIEDTKSGNQKDRAHNDQMIKDREHNGQMINDSQNTMVK